MKYIKTFESIKGITFNQWLKDNPHDINSTEINCSHSKLINLNGIEKFINLKELSCHYNQLTTLPDTIENCTKLEILHCHYNQLVTRHNWKLY